MTKLKDFIDTETVAALLGLPSSQAFLIRRAYLEDEAGFPVALPHWRRPLKYRSDQVLAWLSEQGLPRPASDPDIAPELLSSGKVTLLAEARRP